METLPAQAQARAQVQAAVTGRSDPQPVACRSQMLAPRLSLASCIRGFVVRSTMGVELLPHQRVNHFPATPACSITWFFHGSAQRPDGSMPPGRVLFCGQRTGPSTTVNPGPVDALTMLVMPDAVRLLTGCDADAFVDCTRPASEVFDAEWCAMFEAVLATGDAAAGMRVAEAFIEPRWRAARSDAWGSAHTYRAWAEALALRAALSGLGRSVRQTERRIRAWSGLPMKRLLGLSRAEQALMEALATQAQGDEVRWADVAVDAGYADQSHLCRETRRTTGLNPRELLRRIDEDESYWIYRLWP